MKKQESLLFLIEMDLESGIFPKEVKLILNSFKILHQSLNSPGGSCVIWKFLDKKVFHVDRVKDTLVSKEKNLSITFA